MCVWGGAVLRSNAGASGTEVVGGFRLGSARHIGLLGAAYLEPLALGNDPAAQIYREAPAGPLAVRAASQ